MWCSGAPAKFQKHSSHRASKSGNALPTEIPQLGSQRYMQASNVQRALIQLPEVGLRDFGRGLSLAHVPV